MPGKKVKRYSSIPRDEFNYLSQTSRESEKVCWIKDQENIGTVDPDEIAICEGSQGNIDRFITKSIQLPFFWKARNLEFTDQFKYYYERMFSARVNSENIRDGLLGKELNLTQVVSIKEIDLKGLNPICQQMIRHILNAGRLVEDLFQIQKGSYQYREHVMSHGTDIEKKFFKRYQSIWCDATDEPMCVAHFLRPPRQSGVYPPDFKCEDIKGEEVSNPFARVVKVGADFKGIPFAKSDMMSDKMKEISNELVFAASHAQRLGEAALANYLEQVAAGFTSAGPFPFSDSDEAWRRLIDESQYFLRIGADEFEWDPCKTKAGYYMVFGMIDSGASRAFEKYLLFVPQANEESARIIGTPFKARPVEVQLPVFVNTIMANGEGRGNVFGATGAQSLPNWCGADGKQIPCPQVNIIYTNEVRKLYSPEAMGKIGGLFEKGVMGHYSTDAQLKLHVLLGLAVNFGPRMNEVGRVTGRPYRETFGSELALTLELLKAQTWAVYLVDILKRNGVLSDKEAKEVYTAVIFRCLDQVRRLGQPNPFAKIGAIEVDWFLEHGVLKYDKTAKKLGIDYEMFPAVVKDLYRTVCRLYLEENQSLTDSFLLKYTSGQGFERLVPSDLRKDLRGMQSILFDYQVE